MKRASKSETKWSDCGDSAIALARARNRGKRALIVTSTTIVALALASAACGDVYADPQGEEQELPPQTRVDSGVGSSVFPKDIPTDCPASRPRENTACPASGTTCEFGKSADRHCNTLLACVGGQSSFWDPRPSDACHAKVCPAKPADIASLDGKPCVIEPTPDGGGAPITTVDEAICNMTDGVCACTTGRDGATAHDRKWVCIRPISVCPAARPLAGQPCNGALWCDYGSCAFKRGLLMECKGGHWLTGGAPCQ